MVPSSANTVQQILRPASLMAVAGAAELGDEERRSMQTAR